MEEDKNIFIIAGIILLALLLFQYSPLGTIYSDFLSMPFNTSISQDNFSVVVTSSHKFGTGYQLIDGQYTDLSWLPTQDYPSGCSAATPQQKCGERQILFDNTIEIGTDYLVYNNSFKGNNARFSYATSVTGLGADTYIYLPNTKFNTGMTEKLSFYYSVFASNSPGWHYDDQNDIFAIYLISPTKEILLYELKQKGLSDSGEISITRNTDSLGYTARIKDTDISMSIPKGKYSILIKTGDSFTYHSTLGQADYTLSLANITSKESIPEGALIIYQNQTTITNQTTTQEVIWVKPTFFQKYGIAGTIFIILGGIIVLLLFRRKK